MLRTIFFWSFLFLVAGLTAQIPTNGLISAWPFSGNANDVVGTNNGTVTNAVLTTDRCGNPNSAYSFNGTSSYILTSQLGPTGSASRSLSFWAKTSNTVINNPRATFEYGYNGGNSDSWEIVWNYCAQGVGLDLSNQALIRGNHCLLNNTWHHIVAVYNSSIATTYSSVVFYIDGVPQNVINCNVSGLTASINTGTVYPITIGRAIVPVRYWLGELDDYYLYNRPLTQQEVLQLYNHTPCQIPVFGNTVVCGNTTNTYSVSPVTNATYTWTLPGGWTGSSTSHSINAQVGSNGGTMTVSISTPSCGVIGTSTLNVSITGGSLSITPSQPSVCAANPVTLTANGALTYTWLPGPFFTPTISTNPSATTVYTLYGINSSSCISSTTHTVIVAPSPTITITSPTITSCAGSSVTLSASGAFTYTWQPGNLVGTAITVNPLNSTLYSLMGTAANGCTATASRFITTPTSLSLSIAANSTTVCAGSSLNLTATATGGTPLYNYTWVGGPSGAVKNVTSTSPGTFVYTVTAVDANSCSITRTRSVIYIGNPTITVASMSICPKATGTLIASGASTYTWIPSNTGGNIFVASPSVTTVYTVAGSALGCSATAIGSIIIKPAPLLTFATTSINCAFLGSGTVTATGGIGPFSFTWTPTNQTGSVATNLFPGAYTVSVGDQGSGCVFPLTTTFTPLVPLTGTVSNTYSLLCFGATTGTASIALENGSGNQTYLWTTPPGGTQTNSVALNLAGGINTVQVVDGLTYCTLTKTFSIIQPSALTLVLTPPSASVCLGDSITFSASATGGIGGYTYVWSPATSASVITVKETIANTYPYSVTATDANTCVISGTVSGKFVPNPTVTVVSDTICPLEVGMLVASGASTYSWSSGFAGSPLILSPPLTTAYTVTGTALACTATASGTITVKPLPVPSISVVSTFCQNDTLSLLGAGGGSYLWSGPQGFSSTQASTALTSAQVQNSGTYSLKVTAANGCTASTNSSITINPVPVFVAAASTVCAGSPLYLYASFVNNASYQWSGLGLNSASQNPVRPNSTPSMSGNYDVLVTNVFGCKTISSAHGSVVTMPVLQITADDTVCFGDSALMTVSGGNSYSWNGPNTFYSGSATAVIKNLQLAHSGVYTVNSTYGPCQATAYQSLTVVPLPQPAVSSNQPVCENSSLQLSSSSASGYTWTGPAGQQVGSPMVVAPALLSHSGVYTVTVNDSEGCKGKNTITVTILPAPVISASDASVCLGGAISLTASGGQSYYWTGPQNYTASGASAYIPKVNALNTGIYNVIVTGQNSCTASRNVSLSGVPYALPDAAISGATDICINTQVTLTGSGGVYYQWNGPNNFTSTLQAISFKATDAVTGVYTLSVKNESLCAATQTILVRLVALPQATLNGRSSGCVPFCTTISLKEASDTTALVSSNFQMGQNFYSGPFYHCFYEPGQHFIVTTYRDKNNCVNTSTLQINAYEKPVADFEVTPDKPLAVVDRVHFYNASSGNGIIGYNWFIHGTTNDTIKDRNHIQVYDQPGQFPIVLIAKNTWGCSDTIIKPIIVEEVYNMYVPNAFTPDGDGLNDIFIPKGQGVKSYVLEVYNRWGEQVFFTRDTFTGWDGTFNEQECKSDVYTWKMVITDTGGKKRELTGTVTLLR